MKKYLVLATAAILITGCGGNEVYRGETFSEDSPFRKTFPVTAPKACEGAQLAVLGQGYKITHSDANSIYAQKDFQPDDELNVTIELTIVCKDHLSGSIVFANALQTKYELKKSRQSTSLGIPSVGSISLPMGKTTESLVKVGGETISDQEYYRRFFSLVGAYLEPPKDQAKETPSSRR